VLSVEPEVKVEERSCLEEVASATSIVKEEDDG
jgi:hypothetical protein